MSKPGFHGADLAELAERLLKDGPRKALPTPRRVRVIHNHTFIVDTTNATHVWEHDYYPQLYVPLSELKNCSFTDKTEISSGGKVGAAVIEVTVPGQNGADEVKTGRVLRFADDASLGPLAGLVRLEFNSMDQWLEEDIPIYVHPKDPFKRVDILPSSRPIEVRVAGKTVAKSVTAMHLFETSLPTRYYMPLASVDQSLLRKSSLVTKCPYKGEAEYYSLVMGDTRVDDVVWYYRHPTHESAAIAGMVCFYNEKVDILLDGQLLERPKTHFA